MDDDKTVLTPNPRQKEHNTDHTVLLQLGLRVSLLDASGAITNQFIFSHQFTVGRSTDNDIVIQNRMVSRHHLQVKQEKGSWWIYDLNSVNGIYVNNKLIVQKSRLSLPALLVLGASRISLRIESTEKKSNIKKQPTSHSYESGVKSFHQADEARQNFSKAELKARLLAKTEAENSGDYTRMVRRIIHEDRTVRGRSYQKVIWGLGFLFLLAVVLVAYQQIALSNARTMAIDMFYDIKTLEVSLSQAEIRLEESAEVLDLTMKVIVDEKFGVDQERIKAEQEKIAMEKQRLAQERKKLNNMKARYQQYVEEAKSLKLRLPSDMQYEEELIARVARGFGESELELPDGFVTEVKRYIALWQKTPRMHQAMARLESNNYAPVIFNALDKEGLPLYFMYLPLQESDYDTQAIGPETRFGIAKGAWQFLATTGQEYGLSPGPLAGAKTYDEQDERFDFHQATLAGAKYLKQIYSTEAQASGLLVMASYNYGYTRVRSMIGNMQNNPREKNFWVFIQQYEIPKETYDYVFYIFSAAVIGEDPAHFGFRFRPPLALSQVN